jgi:predicted RNA-binding protein with TRAM domain
METFKINLEVPKKRIVDMFITACEGGSNYWASNLVPKGKTGDGYEAMLEGFTVKDTETGKKVNVTKTDIKNAIGLMAKNYSRHFSDLINENDDAETGDVFLQLCCFQDVIYG